MTSSYDDIAKARKELALDPRKRPPLVAPKGKREWRAFLAKLNAEKRPL